MNDWTIADTLNDFKNKSDENNKLIVPNPGGYKYQGKCTFYKPVTSCEITNFISETGWNLPSQFQDFLLLHNGAIFFDGEYGGGVSIYGIDRIVEASETIRQYGLTDFYVIGSHADYGQIIINNKRVMEGNKNYIFLSSNVIIDFYCDFKMWFERMLFTYGVNYWEWYSKEINIDDLN